MSFTIDELILTTDNQSNPIWYINDERGIHLNLEQEWISKTLYYAEAFGWKVELGITQESVWDSNLKPVQIPIRKTMCTRCRGKGTMANPAFDGTSIEWWQEHGGPDYQDDLDEYLHGDMYDVPCQYDCNSGVAYAADWQRVIHSHDLYKISPLTDRVKTKEEIAADKWINDIYGVLMDWHEGEAEARSEQAYFDREWAI